jgi:hypothetical protein
MVGAVMMRVQNRGMMEYMSHHSANLDNAEINRRGGEIGAIISMTQRSRK